MPNKEEIQMITYTVKAEGMMCAHCAARVEEAVKSVGGVTDARVDLAGKTVTVTGEDGTLDAVRRAITDAGYTVA